MAYKKNGEIIVPTGRVDDIACCMAFQSQPFYIRQSHSCNPFVPCAPASSNNFQFYIRLSNLDILIPIAFVQCAPASSNTFAFVRNRIRRIDNDRFALPFLPTRIITLQPLCFVFPSPTRATLVRGHQRGARASYTPSNPYAHVEQHLRISPFQRRPRRQGLYHPRSRSISIFSFSFDRRMLCVCSRNREGENGNGTRPVMIEALAPRSSLKRRDLKVAVVLKEVSGVYVRYWRGWIGRRITREGNCKPSVPTDKGVELRMKRERSRCMLRRYIRSKDQK